MPSTSRTQVKAHVHRQDPAYTGQNSRMQSINNRPIYTRTKLCTHNYKLVHRLKPMCTKAQTESVL